MVAMTRRIILSALVALVLTACATDNSTTSTTAPPATADAELTAKVREFALDRGQFVLEVIPGDTTVVATSLARTPEEGPIGLGLCITAQEALDDPAAEVRVLTADGGTIASTRNGFCGIRV